MRPTPAPEPRAEPPWARDLCHPLPMAAVLVLAANDHLLKGAGLLPGWLTGKLSDFAGLFFFPVLLVTLAAGLSRALRGRDDVDRRRAGIAAALATSAVFAALKLSPAASAWISDAWGPVIADPTDLLALPMVALAAVWLRRRAAAPAAPRAAGLRWTEAAGVLAAALASVATSRAREPIADAPPPPGPPCALVRTVGCEHDGSRLTALVEVRTLEAPVCRVHLLAAVERADPGRGVAGPLIADELPPPVVVTKDEAPVVRISWTRRSAIQNADEPFVLDVKGDQWVREDSAGDPYWRGSGTLTGTCKLRRLPAAVAQ